MIAQLDPKTVEADLMRLPAAGGHGHPSRLDPKKPEPPGLGDGQDAVGGAGIQIAPDPAPAMPGQHLDGDHRSAGLPIMPVWKTNDGRLHEPGTSTCKAGISFRTAFTSQ